MSKNLKELYNNNSNYLISLLSSSILITIMIIFPVVRKSLSFSPSISDFSDHVMSSATSADIDIDSRIKVYYLIVLGAICLFIVTSLFLNRFFINTRLKENAVSLDYIKNLSFVGIVGALSSILSGNYDFSFYMVGGAVILSFLFLKFSNDNSGIAILMWRILLAIPISFFVLVIARKYYVIDSMENNFFVKKLEIPAEFLFFVLTWFVLSLFFHIGLELIVRFCTKKFNVSEERCEVIIATASIPLMSSAIFQSISLEIINIINKRLDIVYKRPTLLYGIIIITAVFAAIVIYFILKKKNKLFQIGIKPLVYNFYIPLALITFTFIIAQPAKMSLVGNEYFEMANHGLSVDHLFRYGSLPIIETFDAHFLSNQFFAYLYSVLNGYEPWAAFLYDKYIMVLYILVLYFVLRHQIGEIHSFFFIISFTLLERLFNIYFLFSAFLVFILYKYFSTKRNTTKNSILLWIVAVLLCIYRLDLGVAALFAGILTFIVLTYIEKRRSEVLKFLVSGAVVGSFFVILFIILCILKGINPISRLIELITVCLSNQNWAYTNAGDNNLLAYSLTYYVFPFLVVLLLGFIFIKFIFVKRDLIKSNQKNFIMFSFFSLFYLFNISRGIVRHSLAEGTMNIALGTFTLSVLSFLVIVSSEKRKTINFFVFSLILVILTNINIASFSGNFSIAAQAVASPNYQSQYMDVYSFEKTRVNGDIPNDIEELKNIFDVFLSQGETYFDFSSSNYLHSIVGRKNPVYVNQSPLMLSGNRTQKMALNEIKSTKPIFVLMPISGKPWSYIDGIAVDFKYYMISEYIYEHYTPLIRLNNFDVYCLKENKMNLLEKLNKKGLLQKNIYSGNFSFIRSSDLYKNNLTMDMDNEGNLAIRGQGEDPYTIGILSQLMDKYPIKNLDKPTRFVLEYEARVPGKLQFYYTFTQNESFSENQSKTFEINGHGRGSIEVDLPAVPSEIRLDVDVSELTLSAINISQGLNIINEQPEVWTRDIGKIPQLWAEKDREDLFKYAPSLIDPLPNKNSFQFNVTEIKKDQPVYFLLQIESESDQKISIVLSKGGHKSGEFIFNLTKGKHNYVVRLSTDYKWWNGEVDSLIINTVENIKIEKVNFYLEETQDYKEALIDN
ncbi:hypothetical protein FRY98_13745 [Paenibacillus faecis]|uniref:Uncharacterized protein n=1 Tax=Paenibacillus faecis TaxID=862114 RepID=A0A5D0CR64_9BACL|nr:hypothetical protein [Paenibacillus faecis]TYA11814.1 hypothetical protein FRY98_13745 [Paenibacillus faecis]